MVELLTDSAALQQRACEQLFDAARDGNTESARQALLFGADVHWMNSGPVGHSFIAFC